MTAPGGKVGALTQADLQAIWEGACDSSFTQPLEAAGEGNGFEAYTQMFAQWARVSQAVDVTTQAMYILPSSGQSNPPAQRAQKATVQLTFARSSSSLYINWPIVIAPGTVFVAEQEPDWGDPVGIIVQTGRRYLVTQELVIPPGDLGPYTVQATAENAGYGYNNPLGAYVTAAGAQVPGSINFMVQPGTGYSHDRASVQVTPTGAPLPVSPSGTPSTPAAVATLVAVNEPDMFLPQHVGQYVLMTAGSNAGMVGRITGYFPPGTVSPGSAVTLAYDQVVEATGVTGTFTQGEALQIKNGSSIVATATLLAVAPGSAAGVSRVIFTLAAGSFVAGNTLLGTGSGATATISTLLQTQDWVAAGTVPPNPNLPLGSGENWRVLDWVADLGVSVSNTLPPQGGTSAMLDELAYERGMFASTGETSDAFRLRVASPSDTVSPNAIRRAIARALGGTPGTFLDTQTGLTGFFYDRRDAGGFFYDTCCLVMSPSPGFTSTAQPGDVLVWLDANGLLVANGFYAPAPGGATFNFVMRGGPLNTVPLRTIFAAGDRIVDLTTPTSTNLTATAVPACYTSMAKHVYLDYASFRGYFLVGVPPADAGDFGFFWGGPGDAHVGGFYDRGGPASFYDGTPVTTNAVRGQVYREVQRVELGGVGDDLIVDPSLLFTPASLPGLSLWLRADLGASPSTWLDQGPFGNNATGTASPTLNVSDPNFNGLPSFTLNGTTQLFSIASLNMGSGTPSALFIWMVIRLLTPGSTPILWAGPGVANVLKFSGTSGNPQMVGNTVTTATWPLSITGLTKALYGFDLGTGHLVGINVSNAGETTAPAGGHFISNNFAVNIGANGGSFANVSIAEIVVTNTYPGASLLAALQTYAGRYGSV